MTKKKVKLLALALLGTLIPLIGGFTIGLVGAWVANGNQLFHEENIRDTIARLWVGGVLGLIALMVMTIHNRHIIKLIWDNRH